MSQCWAEVKKSYTYVLCGGHKIKRFNSGRWLTCVTNVQIHVQAGEDVLLLDNTDPRMWKIRNGKNQESVVPAPIVLIPGPCAEAIDSAVRLHGFVFSAPCVTCEVRLCHSAPSVTLCGIVNTAKDTLEHLRAVE